MARGEMPIYYSQSIYHTAHHNSRRAFQTGSVCLSTIREELEEEGCAATHAASLESVGESRLFKRGDLSSGRGGPSLAQS